MNVALYFEKFDDLNAGLYAVENVSKNIGAVYVKFASREKFSFQANGQNISVSALNEISAADLDFIVDCSDARGGGISNVPPEKILTPELFVKKFPDKLPQLLFFTYVNAKYHVFATLYPLFALISNPYATVEIIVSDYEFFAKKYSNVIRFYNRAYPGKVRYVPVKVSNIFPNSVRFLVQPTTKARYVYIGDVDIFLLDEKILDYHLAFMQRHQSDFSNVLRNADSLTGLHFIPYDKMYPVDIPRNTDLLRLNDEVLLCRLMHEKNLRFPVNATMSERQTHGVHISYFSRPLLPSMTTFDGIADFPTWGPYEAVEKYLRVRYTEPVRFFIKHLSPFQVELRRLIQIVDIWAFFVKSQPDLFLKNFS